MTDVKGSGRSYDGRARREKALATRRAVLNAARDLLERQGFAATTMAAVARVAGVSAETVYKTFGSKPALVKAVFDVVIAGDDAPVSVADRPETQLIRQQSDARTKLRSYAEGAAERARRSAAIQLVVRNGAASDPALARLWEQLQDERLTGMTMFARHLAETGCLRAEVDVGTARDILWTCISVEVYDLLVNQRGWSPAAYADWLGRTLIASLAPPDPAQTP